MSSIIKQLNNISVDERIKEIKKELPTTKSIRSRDKLVKELKILRNLSVTGVSPVDAFARKKIPVIPSQYRAPIELSNGIIINPDINTLYRNIGFASSTFAKANKSLGEEGQAKSRKELYRAISDLQGVHNPSDETLQKNLWNELSGKNTPKSGFFQRHVTRKRQNLSGRSVITPNPDLDIDEAEIPFSMGFDLYEPFVKKELYSRGYKTKEINEMIKHKDPVAKEALVRVGKERLVLINRAPSIFNTAINAHKPIFTDTKNIAIPNLIAPYLEGDFDGDQVGVHVPISDKAVQEAHEMLPSKNTIREGSTSLSGHPNHESITGLYLLSDTPGGRKQINEILPQEYQIRSQLNKSKIQDLLYKISKDKKQKNVGKVFNDLRKIGNKHVFEVGFSPGLSDIIPLTGIRDNHVRNIKHRIAKIPHDKHYNEHMENVYVDEINKSTKEMEEHYKTHPEELFGIMLSAGSRGSKSQFRDSIISPFSVKGSNNTTPIEHSYIEGLTPSESFAASFGAREGMISKSQETALPGALGKELLATENTVVIGKSKGDYMNSIDLPLDNPDDILDRYISKTVKDTKGNVIAKKNTPVTIHAIQNMKKNKIKSIPVYTPLGSTQPDGSIPGMTYGIDTHTGKMVEPGKNIGAIASLGVVGPLFTGSLQGFHTGGNLDTVEQGYPRLKQLLELSNTLPGEATLSQLDGEIKSITKDSLGGHEIFIDNKEHYVLPSNKVSVKVGDKIRRGDAISGGPIKIQDLSNLKTVSDAQNYMVDEIRKNVPSLRRRSVETIVEGITRYGKVVNPGNTDLDYGDVRFINDIKDKNKNAKEEALFEPLGKGVNMLPQSTQDWLSKFNFRHLKQQFKKDIATGAKTDIHSYSPVPAWAQSTEFGEGEDGKY